MYLRVEENPNCEAVEGRVFMERGEPPRRVMAVLRQCQEKEVWCSVTALGVDAVEQPAWGRRVEDSGEGTCYLVYGGAWGLRLKDPGCSDPWSLEDPHQ